MKKIIQTLDWHNFSLKKDVAGFIKTLRKAFIETGFILVKNHPISLPLLRRNQLSFETFFKELSVKQKEKYVFPELFYQAGYTPMSLEKGEFASIADHKHFYHVSETCENPFISEIPSLRYYSETLFSSFNSFYKELMQVVALSLELRRNHFDNELGNSTLRFIHYPETNNPTIDDGMVKEGGNVLGMCASKHTDINNLTLLFAPENGLQLETEGEWTPVQCDPETIIVNVGDMLQHLTGGLYKSGIHRVVCEPNVERFSSPFFGHRRLKCSVIPLENLTSVDIKKYPFKTVGEYLNFRLKQLGLVS